MNEVPKLKMGNFNSIRLSTDIIRCLKKNIFHRTIIFWKVGLKYGNNSHTKRQRVTTENFSKSIFYV